MIREFKKLKSHSQCITKLKFNRNLPRVFGNLIRDLRKFLDQLSFEIAPQQHQEWFIVALLPHIKLPLMQQKITSQFKGLELAMKLEASPIGDTNVGVQQI